MKKLFILCAAVLFFLSENLNAQQLVSDSLIVHYTTSQVDSIFSANGVPFSPTSGLSCHRLIYHTADAKQLGTTIASGLVVVPDSSTCPLAIAMYDHGTVLQKADVPSNMNYESLLSMILAAQGYFSIAPDYLGLGVSPGIHPYIHARSEAQAGIDLIFASKTFAANNNIALSDQLFLTGYSQGGHACMATHRAIQQNYAGQLTVTASAPGSGPYNLSGIQAAGLAGNNYYADPSYLPYLVIGYQSVYGNLYNNVGEFLKSPWDTVLPPLYNGLISTDSVDQIMPHHVDSFVVDSQLIRYNTDSAGDPLRIDLRDNDVYAWVPNSPILMTYCTSDEQVLYQSSLFAQNYFATHGDSISYVSDGGAYDHLGCVTPYLINVIGFFAQYHIAENNLHLTFTIDSESTYGARNGSVKVSVSGGTGYAIRWSTGSTDSTIAGLSNGNYTVTVTDAKGCTKIRTISTGGLVNGIADLSETPPNLIVSPNPTNGSLNIMSTDPRPETMTIYDVNGQKVAEGKYTTQTDVSSLSAGIYLLEVNGKSGTARSRFVKK